MRFVFFKHPVLCTAIEKEKEKEEKVEQQARYLHLC